MDPREAALRRLVRDDFTEFAKRLKIRSKSGGLERLRLNKAQGVIHEAIEQQRAKHGRVRAIVVKSRQQGCSTLIAARFFHKVIHTKGLAAYIITHQAQATANLFGMVSRFHEHLPVMIKPHVGTANANEMRFDLLDSGYKVGTAGSEGVGRSATIQLLHASESAFWPNAESHADGVLQSVPPDGSEVVFESTANGVGGLFYRLASAAMSGVGDYQLIFTPWWWSAEYQRRSDRVDYPDPWRAYASEHNLSDEQLAWVVAKNEEFCAAIGGDPTLGPCWKLKQEFPSSAVEAFQAGGDLEFIKSDQVARARKAMFEPTGALIIGVDPARGGGDRTGVIDRQGRAIGKTICEYWDERDIMVIASKCAEVIRKKNPRLMVIDVTGVGAGVYDRLVEYGFESRIAGVSFGAQAQDPKRFANRRAEIWDRMREWFSAPDLPVCIPDRDDLHKDLCSPWWGTGMTSFRNERLLLESKDSIKKRLGVSPDLGDAAALTFAMPSAHVLGAGPSMTVENSWDPLSPP